jgi:zinc/manganese transport system ATP-binding protein
VSFEVRGPGIVQVLGPNGAGKTTLFKAIIGAVRPVRGSVEVEVEGVGRVENPYDVIGYVPQYFDAPRDNPMTVYEFVEAAARLRLHGRLSRSRLGEEVSKALEACGVGKSLHGLRLSELSGGLLRRVLMARAIVFEPMILILDEPFTFLDFEASETLASLIGEYSMRSLVLVSTHDPGILRGYGGTVIVLNKRVLAAGDAGEILARIRGVPGWNG